MPSEMCFDQSSFISLEKSSGVAGVRMTHPTVGRDGDKIWRPKAGLGNNADMSLGHVRGWEDAMQREKNAKFHLLGEKQKNQFVAKGRGMAV